MTNPDEKILPILELEELVEIFDYTNRRAAVRAIKEGSFPVPVFKLAGRLVAHRVGDRDLRRAARGQPMLAFAGWIEAGDRLITEPRLDKYRKTGQQERKQ